MQVKILSFLMIFFLLLEIFCALFSFVGSTGAAIDEVKWLGSPITGKSFNGGPAEGILATLQERDVEMGLRNDGVVVWRKRK